MATLDHYAYTYYEGGTLFQPGQTWTYYYGGPSGNDPNGPWFNWFRKAVVASAQPFDATGKDRTLVVERIGHRSIDPGSATSPSPSTMSASPRRPSGTSRSASSPPGSGKHHGDLCHPHRGRHPRALIKAQDDAPPPAVGGDPGYVMTTVDLDDDAVDMSAAGAESEIRRAFEGLCNSRV